MKKKEKKEAKRVKIGKYSIKLSTLLDIIGILILIIVHITSPEVALIVTQKYNQGTNVQNNNVKIALGEENTEEKFNTYFMWYNVIHEVGHGLMRYNSNNKNYGGAVEEQLVNDFAYAYWEYYGEYDRLKQVEEIVNYAFLHIDNDEARGMDYMEYAKKNWHKNSFYDFNNYGYFQFASVKNTFENKKTLPEVLAEMGIEGANLSNNTTMHYDVINKETNDKILYDAINNIHEWGLVFPTTYHKYTNNPYNSYFKGGKRYLYKITSLFDFDLSD